MASSIDAIVIGGGAAGLFCAITAGRRGKRVLLIEHNAEVGRKIIISGGGRCNFTNLNVSAENFVSQNPHFAKSALSRFTPQDFIDLVRSHRIDFYEKKLGQLFCRNSSREIVEMLLTECRRAKVRVETSCNVRQVRDSDRFEVDTTNGLFAADKLVVACGGLSFRKVGSTDLGYLIARQFGLTIVETRPSLVALVAKAGNWKDLAGISVDTDVSASDVSFRENVLFTHRGMSGPAILQISNYWKPGDEVNIDLIPEVSADRFVIEAMGSQKQPANFLTHFLPRKLAEHIAGGLNKREIGLWERSRLETLAGDLKNYRVTFSGTEGYDRAEVTLGGVSTEELSSQTMESKSKKGLHFIGEVVDVTGWLGGYNFQWAWSSGYAAGKSI